MTKRRTLYLPPVDGSWRTGQITSYTQLLRERLPERLMRRINRAWTIRTSGIITVEFTDDTSIEFAEEDFLSDYMLARIALEAP
jgi:hypothetical protein